MQPTACVYQCCAGDRHNQQPPLASCQVLILWRSFKINQSRWRLTINPNNGCNPKAKSDMLLLYFSFSFFFPIKVAQSCKESICHSSGRDVVCETSKCSKWRLDDRWRPRPIPLSAHRLVEFSRSLVSLLWSAACCTVYMQLFYQTEFKEIAQETFKVTTFREPSESIVHFWKDVLERYLQGLWFVLCCSFWPHFLSLSRYR